MYNRGRHIFHLIFTAKIALLLTSVFIAGCKEFALPEADSTTPQATNITIADLHQLIAGRIVDVKDDIIIGGYVTTSDKASNFYKSFFIEDATGGVEVMAGIYDLHNIYPKGSYITISLNGCSLGEHYGTMQVGLKAADYDIYPTSYFASRILLDRHITRYNISRQVPPRPITFSELKPTLCGTLVNMGGLHLVSYNYSTTWEVNTEGTWHGYNIFSDEAGNIIAVHTSDYADYASHSIPDGKLSISGILQLGTLAGEECYMIKMCDEKDCVAYN